MTYPRYAVFFKVIWSEERGGIDYVVRVICSHAAAGRRYVGMFNFAAIYRWSAATSLTT
jgi:hypothetical protein